MMTSIGQSIRNLIKHGKQARQAEPAAGGVQQQQQQQSSPTQQQKPYDAPSTVKSPPTTQPAMANYDVDGAAGASTQKTTQKKKIDKEEIERLVREEALSKNKLPRYPGLERWHLVEKMGDGAFSNVYRARDTALENNVGEVAIKVVRKYELNASQGDAHLHPDFKKQPKVVERANILKEVSIMRQLDHPNIVKLVDFFESKQFYYIILELAQGGELFHQIVRLTYFSEDLSRHVITQVAKALEYLHEEKGVVHRDIKPENLLFNPIPFVPSKNPKPKSTDEEDKVDEGEFIPGVGAGGIGVIKIADFGLSKIVWDAQTMTPCGTVGYTAPEIVKDERYSKSVDMWALGCVLYTLLCGFPPFYDESIQVLTEKVARGQYTFLSPWWDDISKSAQDLISHLLTVDPEKRYTIKEFLAHPWIRNSKEPTYAAHDAPPIATPAAERQKQLGGKPLQAFNPDLLESPGSRRMDFRSPGAVNLREVFDVGYAVHRQEEEAKRRKNFPQGYKGQAGFGGLNPIDDDEADNDTAPPNKVPKPREADVHGVEQGLRNANLNAAANARQAASAPRSEARGYGQHSPAVAAAARQQVRNRNKGAFELNMDGASILGRRGQKPAPSGLRETTVVQ